MGHGLLGGLAGQGLQLALAQGGTQGVQLAADRRQGVVADRGQGPQGGAGLGLHQPVQIKRAASLGTGAGQTHAAKRLHPYHGTNHVAVDIQVAGVDACAQVGNGLVDAAVHAKGQAVAGGIDAVDQGVQRITAVAHHVQHRAEHLALQTRRAVDLDQGRCHIVAVQRAVLARGARHRHAGSGHALDMGLDLAARFGVDHRADVGGQAIRVAQGVLLQRLFEHADGAIGHVFLHAQQAQRRTALAGRVECRCQHIAHHLLGQRGGIDHHGILATGFGDQRNRPAFRAQALRQRAGNQARHFGGAGKHHAMHARVRHQGGPGGVALAGHQLQRVLRDAGGMQDGHHGRRRQRGLFGRLGQHRIAGRQRGGDLAAENRQREVPRADGQHHAQRALAGIVEIGRHLGRVVAQKIDCFAHFGDGIRQGLAGFAHDQAQQGLAALLQQIGGALQHVGAAGGRGTGPDRGGLGGTLGGGGGFVGTGFVHMAHGIGQFGRVAHGLPAGCLLRLIRQGHFRRGGQLAFTRAVQQGGRQRGQLLFVGQVETLGVGAGLCTQLAKQGYRQRNARMGCPQHAFLARQLLGIVHRIRHQRADRHAGIANAVHERGVGAVFQQAAHQVGQQGFVVAHRRVDTAGAGQLAIGRCTGDLLVQRFSHAMQALEFVLAAVVVAAGHVVDAGQRLRIVGGKLRIDSIGCGQQLARTGQVADIGIDLARVHRVAGQAIQLGALDLAVPVGAFHQTHHQPAAAAAGQVHQGIDHLRAAFLVRLHHKADAVPALERRCHAQRFQQVQRQLQPIGFLGIDIHADVVVAGQFGQMQQARQQFGHHALVLGPAVARVQRRQLDGNARPLKNATPGRGRANGVDRLLVRLQVAQGIGFGGGGFAQHVVAVAKALFLEGAAVGQRLGNILAGHELLAHQLHGTMHALANDRFAALADDAAQGRSQGFFAGGGGQLAGNHQAPGRRVHEQRRRTAHMRTPVAVADLVADQGITRGLVGNAQQRFGQAHQRDAFLAGQRELLHQRGHAAGHGGIAQALHQLAGQLLDGLGLPGIAAACQRQQHGQAFRLRAMPGGGDGGAQLGLRQNALGKLQKRLHLLRGIGLHLGVVADPFLLRGDADGVGATLQCIHVLHDSLLDQPVRRASQLLCGHANAFAQGVVDLDSYGGTHQ